MKDRLHGGSTESQETRCILHCTKKNEGFKTSSKVQYVARVGNFIDGGADYCGTLQILKVILSYGYLWQNIRVKAARTAACATSTGSGKDILSLTGTPTWKDHGSIRGRGGLSEGLYSQ